MFDLVASGPGQSYRGRTTATVVSVVGHAVVIALAVVLPLLYATDAIPTAPAMMAFVVDAPAPPPPPPPPSAPVRPTPKAEAARPQPTTSRAFAAPVEAPAEVRPEPASAATFAGEGGVEGGIEGGVAGGIIGGLVAAPPPPPPPPPVQPTAPVRIGGAIKAPALVKRVEPVYPDVALMAKVGGMVILEAVVGPNGSVESVRILRSVKFLDQAAIDAVKQWQYSPLMLNGNATPFVLTVTLGFHVGES
jgi:periplasmic protein TonB